MRQWRNGLLIAGLAAILVLGLAACGGGDEPEPGQSVEPATSAAPAATAATSVAPAVASPTSPPTVSPSDVVLPTSTSRPTPEAVPPPVGQPETHGYHGSNPRSDRTRGHYRDSHPSSRAHWQPGAAGVRCRARPRAGRDFHGRCHPTAGPPPHESLMLGVHEAIYRQASAAAVLGFQPAGIPDHLFIYNSVYYEDLIEKAKLADPTELTSSGESTKIQHVCIDRNLPTCVWCRPTGRRTCGNAPTASWSCR